MPRHLINYGHQLIHLLDYIQTCCEVLAVFIPHCLSQTSVICITQEDHNIAVENPILSAEDL